MLSKLELRTLDIASPDVDRTTGRIDHRLMHGIEPALAPAKLHGKSARRLRINMNGLTVDVPAGSHTDRRPAHAQEMIRAHDIVERFHSNMTCCSRGDLPGMHGANAKLWWRVLQRKKHKRMLSSMQTQFCSCDRGPGAFRVYRVT